MIQKANIEKTNSWPFIEAKKILKARKNYIDKKGALFIKPHEHKLDGIFAVKLTKLNV